MGFKFLGRWKLYSFLLLIVILLVQYAYYMAVIQNPPPLPTKIDLILVYGIDPIQLPPAIELARQYQVPYFMVSERELYDLQSELKKYGQPGSAQIFMDGQATTTDQNARFTAAMIRHLPVKRAVLVTVWFHMPRSLFFTRLYLLGSSVQVYPYSTYVFWPGWQWGRDFWIEYGKFWGSLGRVALALMGIVTGPSGPPAHHLVSPS